MWQAILLGVLGIWEVVASYLYVPSGGGQTVLIITGLVVAILGFWEAASLPEDSGSRHLMQH